MTTKQTIMTVHQLQVKLRGLSNQLLNSDFIFSDKRNDVRDVIQKLIIEIELENQ